KDPTARPPNGLAVFAELEQVRLSDAYDPAIAHERPEVLTRVEQRFVSIMLAQLKRASEPTDTLNSTQSPDEMAHLAKLVRSFGCDLTDLGGGAILIVPGGQTSATDRAAQTASCALRIRREIPLLACAALATGKAETTGGLLVG